MQMSHEEIRRNYNEAKNKNQQIKILADLNTCTTKEIKKIIGIGNCGDKSEKTNKAESGVLNYDVPQEELKLSDIMDQLYKNMEDIDKQLKEMEGEYKKIVITIETLGKIEAKGRL